MGKEIKHPKVSVIIPVYNTEKYLRECLDSVVNQTLKDIEIICVDDGSTDNSLGILKEYAAKDERFVILEQENQGAGAARNKGLEIAKGEYLSFLDSDDYFALQMLEKMYASGSAYGSDMVVCEASKFDVNSGKIINVFGINLKKVPNTEFFTFNEIKDNWSKVFIPAAWNKLYKTQFIKDNELYFQNISSCNDIGFSLCATAISSKISIIPEVLVFYRKNTKSCISHSRGKNAINIILAYKYIVKYLQDNKRLDLRNCLNESIKDNIKFEISNCDSLQFYKFKRQARNLLGSDWPIFKQCFKTKSSFSKLFLNVFSIVNSDERTHKVITILGLKIKLKRKKQQNFTSQDYLKFIYHNIKEKSVLLTEPNSFHGECLSGMAKYFLDLGYNVDVLLNKKEAKLMPFSGYFDGKISVFPAIPETIKSILCSDIIEQYDYLYINSNKYKNQSVSEYIGNNIKYPTDKIITMHHDAKSYGTVNFNTSNFEPVYLAEFPILKNKEYKKINAHFYKEIGKHTKNNLTQFVVVGNIESFRKNHDSLLDTVSKLVEEGITNFKITIISRIGDLELPAEIKNFFEFKKNLAYPRMYAELEQADFLLTLFDTNNPEHDRYITTGSSGTYQLSYGFNIPVLIPYKFQTAVNGFNNSNSVGYKDNEDLITAMKFCINMEEEQYSNYKSNLANLEREIYDISLSNLRGITESNKSNSKSNYYISLGENCFNRVVLTRHHLKPRKSEGEKSLPFDLCVCPLKTVASCLQNNFEGYFSDLKWDKDSNLWQNKKLHISYNHDIDCSKNDKEKLVARYKNRIENFKQLLKNNDKKVFIISLIKSDEDDYKYINQIDSYLIANCHSEYKLIIVNISKKENLDSRLLHKNIFYKHIPHPYPNYWGEWFKGEYFNSEQGRTFESEYINFVNDCTVDNLNKEIVQC